MKRPGGLSIIDGYAHCGISKYRPVEDVLAMMQSAGVDRAVLCQHLGEYDNQYLAQVVTDHPTRFAAVCLVDPAKSSAQLDLDRWQATGRFRGVRLLAEWLAQHESLWARAVELGLILVIYAPQGIATAVPAITRFVATHRSARIVVTHLGTPRLSNGQIAETDLLLLAEVPGVFVQLSGLSMVCGYPYAYLRSLIVSSIREFGVQRIYWGSNYPVCGGDAEYRRDLLQVVQGEWDLTPEQIAWISGGTAERLWFD